MSALSKTVSKSEKIGPSLFRDIVMSSGPSCLLFNVLIHGLIHGLNFQWKILISTMIRMIPTTVPMMIFILVFCHQ